MQDHLVMYLVLNSWDSFYLHSFIVIILDDGRLEITTMLYSQ